MVPLSQERTALPLASKLVVQFEAVEVGVVAVETVIGKDVVGLDELSHPVVRAEIERTVMIERVFFIIREYRASMHRAMCHF